MNSLVVIGLAISLLASNGLGVLKSLGSEISKPQPSTSHIIPFEGANYTPAPTLNQDSKPYNSLAFSAIIYDVDSGVILYQKDPNAQHPIASITKLMTALVIMDSHKPDEVISIGDIPTLGLEDQKLGIKQGEKFILSDLLKALLIYSANDVANALAIYDSGSLAQFSEKMNNKARDWGLTNTSYLNPSGLDQDGQYSSARDVVTIANLLVTNKTFTDIVKTANTQITNSDGKVYAITTTNKILGQGGVIGIKTGTTLAAGLCLVTLAENNGHRIISVVIDSPDRFQESKSMIDWAFRNYIWQ